MNDMNDYKESLKVLHEPFGISDSNSISNVKL